MSRRDQYFGLCLLLILGAATLSRRTWADYKAMVAQGRPPSTPSFYLIPPIEAYDAQGHRLVIPAHPRRTFIFAVHRNDFLPRMAFWREFLGDPAAGNTVAVGFLSGRFVPDSGAVAAFPPGLYLASYANYQLTLLASELERRNQIAVLDARGRLIKRLPQPRDTSQLQQEIQ